MRKAPYLAVAAALVGATACQQAATTPNEATFDARVTAPGFGSKPVVLQFRGTDNSATPQQVPDPFNPGNTIAAVCFTIDLVDVNKDKVVGEATDCISGVGEANGGLQVVETATFDFGGGHTFTAQGLVSVQATTHGSPDVTHITGSIPVAGQNDIIAGTGRYRRLEASVRLSGAADLSAFPAAVTFDCLLRGHGALRRRASCRAISRRYPPSVPAAFGGLWLAFAIRVFGRRMVVLSGLPPATS